MFLAAIPLSRSFLEKRAKGHGKLSMKFTADHPTIETIFRVIMFVSQFSFYGAVAILCVKNLKLIKMDQGHLMF